MSAIISASGLSKKYGKKLALKHINFDVEAGRIIGLLGPNGSGKTTILKAILGLTDFDGELSVLGLNPRTQRDTLMTDICFIADVATLPRWMRVDQALDFVEGVHPKFHREKAERYMAASKLKPDMKVKSMSKGMIVQLHLALVMAIDAKILVLDEPTLGLDVLYRKMFYQNLLEDYFDENKTVIIATHQVEEIEHIVSDVIFILDGEIVMQESMDQLEARFTSVIVRSDFSEQAQAFKPLVQRRMFDKQAMLFDGVARKELEVLGELQAASLLDIFTASMKGSYQ